MGCNCDVMLIAVIYIVYLSRPARKRKSCMDLFWSNSNFY